MLELAFSISRMRKCKYRSYINQQSHISIYDNGVPSISYRIFINFNISLLIPENLESKGINEKLCPGIRGDFSLCPSLAGPGLQLIQIHTKPIQLHYFSTIFARYLGLTFLRGAFPYLICVF